MNVQLSPREHEIIEARAKATSRAEMAELLGVKIDVVTHQVWRLNLPRFGRCRVHSDETINAVKAKWLDGQTPQQIASDLGLGKKQVTGIVFRAGLYEPKKRQPAKTEKRKSRYQRVEFANFPSRPPVVAEPFDARTADVTPLHIGFADLEDHHCREPYGDGPNYTYCGHRAIGSSYCVAHIRINYRPADTRNRDPRPR